MAWVCSFKNNSPFWNAYFALKYFLPFQIFWVLSTRPPSWSIEKNNDVRNGKAVIKGTRITTKEVLLIMSECPEEKDVFEYICEQYPTIESREQIIYAIMYEINKINTINFILKVVMNG